MMLQESKVDMFLAHLLQWSNCTYVSLLSHGTSNWILYQSAKSGLTSPFFETKQIVDLKQQTKLSQQAVCPMFWKRAELITSFLALKTSYCVRNPSIYNRICWFAESLGKMTLRPSIWCSKRYFFLISYRKLKTLYSYLCKFIKRQKNELKQFLQRDHGIML